MFPAKLPARLGQKLTQWGWKGCPLHGIGGYHSFVDLACRAFTLKRVTALTLNELQGFIVSSLGDQEYV